LILSELEPPAPIFFILDILEMYDTRDFKHVSNMLLAKKVAKYITFLVTINFWF